MKYTLYATVQHSERTASNTWRIGMAHIVKHYKCEADSIIDAMAKFAKDEKKMIKENAKLGWTHVPYKNGYAMEYGSSMRSTYTDFEWDAE